MSAPKSPYKMRPPVLSVTIEDSMDIMIARDTARRAGGLLGFSPAHRAQIGSAAATLAELVLKTNEPHLINLTGVINNLEVGLQISTATPWLAGKSSNNVTVALQTKMGDLVDEIHLEQDPITIIFIMWLNHDRQ